MIVLTIHNMYSQKGGNALMKKIFTNMNIVNIVILFFSIVYIYLATDMEDRQQSFVGSSFLPILVGDLLLVCTIILIFKTNFKHSSSHKAENSVSIRFERKHLLLVVFFILYFFMLKFLGFIFSTLILTLAINFLYGVKGIVYPIVISLLLTSSVYFLFKVLLGVPLNSI